MRSALLLERARAVGLDAGGLALGGRGEYCGPGRASAACATLLPSPLLTAASRRQWGWGSVTLNVDFDEKFVSVFWCAKY